MAAVLCVFLYGAGYLIPSSRLMTAGYAGLFLTILFFLLHLQLHACDNFLSMAPVDGSYPEITDEAGKWGLHGGVSGCRGCFYGGVLLTPRRLADPWDSVCPDGAASVSGPFSSGSSK